MNLRHQILGMGSSSVVLDASMWDGTSSLLDASTLGEDKPWLMPILEKTFRATEIIILPPWATALHAAILNYHGCWVWDVMHGDEPRASDSIYGIPLTRSALVLGREGETEIVDYVINPGKRGEETNRPPVLLEVPYLLTNLLHDALLSVVEIRIGPEALVDELRNANHLNAIIGRGLFDIWVRRSGMSSNK